MKINENIKDLITVKCYDCCCKEETKSIHVCINCIKLRGLLIFMRILIKIKYKTKKNHDSTLL